jgi:hypothetical protein
LKRRKKAEKKLFETRLFVSDEGELSAPFTPLKALDPQLLEQLKGALPGPLFEQLNGSLTCDQERLRLAKTGRKPPPFRAGDG